MILLPNAQKPYFILIPWLGLILQGANRMVLVTKHCYTKETHLFLFSFFFVLLLYSINIEICQWANKQAWS